MVSTGISHNIVFIAVSIVFVLAALAAIWWYYPFVRKTWGPTLEVEKRTRKVCSDVDLEYPPENPRVVISKKKRQLILYNGGIPVKTYKAVLGTNPVEDKRKEGDRCTPEGVFYICTRNDRSRYHLFLGISYPNVEDAERGRKTGLIDRPEYKEIIEANTNRERPPWNTKLGGEIGIHGGGTGSDWTFGCIAVSNNDIEELFMLLDIGTPVEITHE